MSTNSEWQGTPPEPLSAEPAVQRPYEPVGSAQPGYSGPAIQQPGYNGGAQYPGYGGGAQHPQAQTVIILSLVGICINICAFIAWFMGAKAKKVISAGAPYVWDGNLKTGYWIAKIVSIIAIVVWALWFISVFWVFSTFQ